MQRKTMKSRVWRGSELLGLACALAVLAPAGGRADGIEAGLWQVINKPAIDGVAGPTARTMRCLTEADVADLAKTFSPVSRTVNSACDLVEHEFSPQRLKWRLQCTGQVDMEVAGDFIFDAADHYTGVVTARSSMGGRPMQDVLTEIEGKRVGPCP
jgi:hypothetical protein